MVDLCTSWLQIIFIGATVVQLCYWILLFSRLAFYKVPTKPLAQDTPPVSIVICARNEATNLQCNLPHILGQAYPNFEVVVVNDRSTDDTGKILAHFQQQNGRLRIVNIQGEKKYLGKKAALSQGIEAAQYNFLLLTDADCCPNSEQWLYHMQSHLKNGISIGLGYGPYEERAGFLNKFIRFEAVYTAIQYCSFALAGLPYMGVGRNLIYKKQHFQEANGFETHKHIASGDDDLFIKQVANGQNTAIILHPATFLYSPPKNTWRAYYRQKSRHMTTGKYYKNTHKWLLGGLSLAHFLHYIVGFALIFKSSTIFVLEVYVARIFVLMLFYVPIMKKLHEPSLTKWLPVLDALYVAYYVLLAPALFTRKTSKWK